MLATCAHYLLCGCILTFKLTEHSEEREKDPITVATARITRHHMDRGKAEENERGGWKEEAAKEIDSETEHDGRERMSGNVTWLDDRHNCLVMREQVERLLVPS